MRRYTTPWVRRALERDPVEAMKVEGLIVGLEGSLGLFAKSGGGPFKAIYHAPGDDSLNGKRGEGRTISDAVARAIE